MKNSIIHTAITGKKNFSNKAYFFNADQYVRYDWKLDRAEDTYPYNNSAWKFPAPFNTGLDAAINGQGPYEGKAYFFKGNQYIRYDWTNDSPDAGYPQPLSAWKFPASFLNGIDAAVSGEGPYAGKAYFFKGNQYIRYDWAGDSVDAGYPQSLNAWKLPAPFNAGIDAAISGTGQYEGKLYFFKGNSYLRYNWSTDTVENVALIIDGWPLLKELLHVSVAKTKALQWIDAALPKLHAYKVAVQANTTPAAGITDQALNIHFHIPPTMPGAVKLPHLNTIENNFNKVRGILLNNNCFRGRILQEAKADHGADSSGVPYPAYTFFNSSINFTSTFARFGPLCQAAMVLHEPVHFVDSAADGANDFYEHGAQYATITVNQAVHNPSSYVCFAEHLFYGKDERYGAGRATE